LSARNRSSQFERKRADLVEKWTISWTRGEKGVEGATGARGHASDRVDKVELTRIVERIDRITLGSGCTVFSLRASVPLHGNNEKAKLCSLFGSLDDLAATASHDHRFCQISKLCSSLRTSSSDPRLSCRKLIAVSLGRVSDHSGLAARPSIPRSKDVNIVSSTSSLQSWSTLHDRNPRSYA